MKRNERKAGRKWKGMSNAEEKKLGLKRIHERLQRKGQRGLWRERACIERTKKEETEKRKQKKNWRRGKQMDKLKKKGERKE